MWWHCSEKMCVPFTDNNATVNCVHHTKSSVWRLGLKHVPHMVAMSHSVWKQQSTLLKPRFLYKLSLSVIFFYMSIMKNAFTNSNCFTNPSCLPIQFSIMHVWRKVLWLVLHYILPWDHHYFKSILKSNITCVSLLNSWSRACFTISKQILQTSSLSGGSCWCSHTVWIQCFTAPHDLAVLSKQIIFNQ